VTALVFAVKLHCHVFQCLCGGLFDLLYTMTRSKETCTLLQCLNFYISTCMLAPVDIESPIILMCQAWVGIKAISPPI